MSRPVKFIAGALLASVVLSSAAAAGEEMEGPILVPSHPLVGRIFTTAEDQSDEGRPGEGVAGEPQAEDAGSAHSEAPAAASERAPRHPDAVQTAETKADAQSSDEQSTNAQSTDGEAGNLGSSNRDDTDQANGTAAGPNNEEAEKPADTEQGSTDGEDAGDADEREPEPPRRELSPAMAALRDRVRRTLAVHARNMLSTNVNNVTEVIHACRAYGCDANVHEANSLGKPLNAITCLCWNYPCAGFTPLTIADGHLTGRIGYGHQDLPGQLLATLALARVKDTYPARVGDDVRTVADLVEYEKLACREGIDKSLLMIGLVYYAGRDGEWENRLGDTWSIERILAEELDAPILEAPFGGTQRLMGISYVVDRRQRREQPLTGQYERAADYIGKFQDYALKLQNEDGTWNGRYFAARGSSGNAADSLASTARILEWLAFSLPEERLADPRVVRSVHWLDRMLSQGRYGRNVRGYDTAEIASVMHGLAALRIYDSRYFKPADPLPEEESGEESSAAGANVRHRNAGVATGEPRR